MHQGPCVKAAEARPLFIPQQPIRCSQGNQSKGEGTSLTINVGGRARGEDLESGAAAFTDSRDGKVYDQIAAIHCADCDRCAAGIPRSSLG
jgi:hypothetical protein